MGFELPHLLLKPFDLSYLSLIGFLGLVLLLLSDLGVELLRVEESLEAQLNLVHILDSLIYLHGVDKVQKGSTRAYTDDGKH